jgi:hypothetical protein
MATVEIEHKGEIFSVPPLTPPFDELRAGFEKEGKGRFFQTE